MEHTSIDSHAIRGQWMLRSDVISLNHGSFGAAPKPVLAARDQWTARLQSNPMEFFTRRYAAHLEEARGRLASFVGAAADNLAFVGNTTVGMNVAADSITLQPGDEVLASDHEYGAVLRIWERACRRAGARLIVQPLPVPMTSIDDIVAPLVGAITSRTRVLVISHVTSPTAIVFPVEALCRAARERGVTVCIDGAHGVAMRPLYIQALDCDYYSASCHKWLSAPVGSGFLFVHPRAQHRVQPPVLSWGVLPDGASPSWRQELEWSGTHDPANLLSIPAAIDFLESVGLEAFRRHTHALAEFAREQLKQLEGVQVLTPDSLAWYGSMVSLALPDGDVRGLRRVLWERYGIEAMVTSWNNRRLLRVSCHLYTQRDDILRLVAALRSEL